MNEPIFVISGKERRKEKHRLAELKLFVKMFWFYEDIDRVYGSGMEDEDCQVVIDITNEQIKELEKQLAIKI